MYPNNGTKQAVTRIGLGKNDPHVFGAARYSELATLLILLIFSPAMEKRQALDREWYTYDDFCDFYGAEEGPRLWDASLPAGNEGRDVEPLAVTSVPPASSILSWLDNTSHSSVEPPAAVMHTRVAPDTNSGPTSTCENRTVFTLAQLNQTEQVPGFGGKAANRKQRSMREELLPRGIYDYDLTNDDWNWKQILKALPPNVQRNVVGAGIVRFSFRLLQNEMDPNYRGKIDSGERHVFQIDRADGSAVHLHFHKNGKMDAPKILEGACDSGAIPPAATFKQEHLLPPNTKTTLIGRNEAHISFLNIMGHSKKIGALDVTDEVGFAWTRFLQNQFQKHEMIGPGIVKALVARFQCDDDPSLVLCRSDDRYVVITPASNSKRLCIYDAWRAHPMFKNVAAATTPWMQIKG